MAGSGISCEECGTDVPSLGSLQMHRLRNHPNALNGPPPAPPTPPGTAGASGPKGRAGRRAAVLGVAVALLLGGGAFAVTRSRTGAPTKAELTALAKRAVLSVADFPTGWTADPPDTDQSVDQEGDRTLAECLGAPYDNSPNAADASFSAEGGLSVSSEFSIAPSREWAEAEFATLSDVAAPGCFEKVLRTMLDKGKEPGDSYTVKVTRLDATSFIPRTVAPSAGFRASISLRRLDASLPMIFDFLMLRHDRMEAMLTFNSVGTTGFPPELMHRLTNKVTDRLAG